MQRNKNESFVNFSGIVMDTEVRFDQVQVQKEPQAQ